MATSLLSNALRIVPLGGLGEVGKNMMAIESGPDIVVIDSGVLFPKEDMPGIDLVVPDIAYLRKHKEKIRAILITHGHEDHVGALPYVLPDLDVPVYAPPLARDLIRVKLQEHRMLRGDQLQEVRPGDQVELGSITAEFFQVCHSIPDACGIALHTPSGVIIHTGDFKIDHTPVDGKRLDIHRLAELGSQGVLLLLSDSTYAEEAGHTPSEQRVGVALDHVIGDAPGRVLVATFASLIARVQQIIDAAVKHGRKVAVVGRSMENNVRMAVQNGYIKVPRDTLIQVKELATLPLDQQVIVMTGSQGEPTSVLVRISNQKHRDISTREGDTVVISATAIPGNETMVHRTIDNLNRQGARVLHGRTHMVHVHGHGSQEELKTMLNIVRPRYFVPIHGEYRMLVAHAELAKEVGIPRQDIFVLENGDVLEIASGQASATEHVQAGNIYIDGLKQHDEQSFVLRDRRALSRDGFATAVVCVDRITGDMVSEPEMVSSGIVDHGNVPELKVGAIETIRQELENGMTQGMEQSELKNRVTNALTAYLYKQTGRRPLVTVVLVETG